MSLKTLSSTEKAAFTKAGFDVTPHFEHIAAVAKTGLPGITIDWTTILADVAKGIQIATAILAIFGINISPGPNKMACKPGCCDHCDCCCQCIKKTLDLLKCELHHCCCCMDESNHCG